MNVADEEDGTRGLVRQSGSNELGRQERHGHIKVTAFVHIVYMCRIDQSPLKGTCTPV